MHCCRAGNVQELNHRMGGLGTSGNTETETEVRKRKYGSEKKSRLLVPGSRMCLVRQRVTVSKQCESQVLIHWTPVSTNTVV